MGKTLMDGTEQILFENTELGEYSGYVFLDKMQEGDVITIRAYIKDVEYAVYKKFLEEEISGVLTCSVLRLTPIIGKVGLKITAQQTVGTYREITHMWFKR